MSTLICSFDGLHDNRVLRYYPVYFGYDAKGEICAVYVRFIDIEANYKKQG